MKILPSTLTPEQRKKRITTIIIVVILALAITIGIMIYFSGKRKGAEGTTVNISSPLAPDGSSPVASVSEIRQIAENLHTDMDGANVFGHDIAPWNSFLALNDSDVIRVNNEFNTQFQIVKDDDGEIESNETFKQWVENESAQGQFYTIKPIVLARLAKLNIT